MYTARCRTATSELALHPTQPPLERPPQRLPRRHLLALLSKSRAVWCRVRFRRHAGVEERVDLVVGVLLGGRDARVSEAHGVENTGPAGILVVDSRREFSTLLNIERRLAGRASTNDRFSTPAHRLPPRAP